MIICNQIFHRGENLNKKILIAIIAAVIAVCVVIGAAEIISSSKDKEISETTVSENETDLYIPGENDGIDDAAEPSGNTNSTLASETSADANTAEDTAEASSADTSAGETSSFTKSSNSSKSVSTAETNTAAKTSSKKTTSSAKSTSAAETKTTAKSKTTTSTAAKEESVKTTAAAEKETEKKTLNVTISISCKNALDYMPDLPSSGYFLKSTKYKTDSGNSVFDLLQKACADNSISLKYQSKYYIQGIGGLNEKDCSSSSGWMYRVNGTSPSKSACNYILSDGDNVEWYYVVNSSDR